MAKSDARRKKQKKHRKSMAKLAKEENGRTLAEEEDIHKWQKEWKMLWNLFNREEKV